MNRMSFAMTTQQVRDEIKTETRRLGWLRLVGRPPGTRIAAVEKAMGFRRGERAPTPFKIIVVQDARREPLSAIDDAAVAREGFPGRDAAWFVDMFCRSHRGCRPDTMLTVIRFDYLHGGHV